MTLERCSSCAFPHGKLVGSRGNPASPLAIVGESPGVLEIRDGKPFVGPSGEILKAALVGHEALDPFITNAHICFPGTRAQKTPEKVIQATSCCQERLRMEVAAFPRRVILALGNAAMWGLSGDYTTKSTQIRGKLYPSALAEIGIVASVHPSYLLHGGGSLRQFRADVDYACSLASGRGSIRRYIVPEFKVVSSEAEIIQLAKDFDGQLVAADTETGGYSGFDHLRDHVLCSGFCCDPSLVHIIPAELTKSTTHLFNATARFVWHNGKFDAKFFRAAAVHNVRVDEDTMLLSYAADETKGVHDLEQVASDVIGAPDWKYMIQPYLQAAKNAQPRGYNVTYADIPLPVLYDYTARDISSTLQIFPFLRSQVSRDHHLEKLYTKTLIPTSEYLVWVEEAGMKLDLKQVNANEERLGKECDEHTAQINAVARELGQADINPNSPLQLAHLLYDVLKLKPSRGPKTRSTDVDSLDKLDPENSVVKALKKYRKSKKALSTYVVPAKDHLDSKDKFVAGWVNPITGRVHTTYKIHGTATGRLASEDPNLLNIPRDPMLRGQFVADDGKILLDVDTNQAELRVLAELSQDPELIRIYTTTGLSIHDEVRNEIFGDVNKYTSDELEYQLDKFNVRHHGPDEWLYELKAEQKMKAKNVNFGIPYGISEYGLAEQIDDTVAVARDYLNKWYKKFSGARVFLLKCRESVALNRVFVTPFGRKRRFGVVSPERLNDQQNQASNFPMQSIASDIVLQTGIYMAPRVRKHGIRIVNTVYDSILYECPLDIPLLQDLSASTVERIGITAKEWGIKSIPITGEGKLGTRWGQLTPIDKWLTQRQKAA